MTTVLIDNSSVFAQNLLNYISTFSFVKVIENNAPATTEEEPYDLHKSLESAFADVKLMKEGKKKGKSLDELIKELRQESEYELQNGSNRYF